MDCGPPPRPNNGQVSHRDGTTFRQTARYSCNAGYNLKGGSIHTCEATGTWSDSEPACLRKLLLKHVVSNGS